MDGSAVTPAGSVSFPEGSVVKVRPSRLKRSRERIEQD